MTRPACRKSGAKKIPNIKYATKASKSLVKSASQVNVSCGSSLLAKQFECDVITATSLPQSRPSASPCDDASITAWVQPTSAISPSIRCSSTAVGVVKGAASGAKDMAANLGSMASNLEGMSAEDLVDPETWKGLYYMLDMGLRTQVTLLKERVTGGGEGEEEGDDNFDDWDDWDE